MSYLPETPPDARASAIFDQIRAGFGFVPNFFRAQTLRSDLIESEVSLMGSILLAEGALTRREKEYLFIVCSAANLSTYCVTAHCEIVRILGIGGPEPEQVALDHTSTSLPMATKALLSFALKLNNQPARLNAGDIEALQTYGYSDQQIMETVVVVGFAKFANYVAFGLGTLPDFEPRVELASTAGAAR